MVISPSPSHSRPTARFQRGPCPGAAHARAHKHTHAQSTFLLINLDSKHRRHVRDVTAHLRFPSLTHVRVCACVCLRVCVCGHKKPIICLLPLTGCCSVFRQPEPEPDPDSGSARMRMRMRAGPRASLTEMVSPRRGC